MTQMSTNSVQLNESPRRLFEQASEADRIRTQEVRDLATEFIPPSKPFEGFWLFTELRGWRIVQRILEFGHWSIVTYPDGTYEGRLFVILTSALCVDRGMA